MGQIIDLADERARRYPLAAAMQRLDAAVGRLDPLVQVRERRLGPAVSAELAAISAAVSGGRPDEAARRAERLADRLEHPAALGS